jgi:membrane-bound lytic murein transglycosylase D
MPEGPSVRRSGFALRGSICLLVLLVGLLSAPNTVAQATTKKTVPLEKKVADLEAEVKRLRGEVYPYDLGGLPDTLLICGKKLNLGRVDLRERFEREYFQFLDNRGLLTVLVKRHLKYLNMIGEEIKRMSLPSDLVYLVVTESYLNPRSLSKANAAGLWQFMKETGKREGLYVNDYVDERYNVKKSTRSALAHLKRLHNELGDWLLAMAAYNAGSKRVRDAMENQGTREFFDLFLPEETERYIFRIAALKEILGNRERYGLQFDEKELYKPVSLTEVYLDITVEIHATTLSKSMDLTYKAFRDLNLHLRRYKLPKGSYTINVPTEKYQTFLRRIKGNSQIHVLKKPGRPAVEGTSLSEEEED